MRLHYALLGLALVACLTVLVAGCDSDDDDGAVGSAGTVNGRVVNSHGNALAGVQVTIGGRTATTNAAGQYSMDGVPTGSQRVAAVLAGFELAGGELFVQINAGPNALADIAMAADDDNPPDGPEA